MSDGGAHALHPEPPRRFGAAALVVLALAPVLFVLARAMAVARNVAYLDDIDGTLMLLVRLHEGGSWSDVVRWLFEVDNEHRMVTSRLFYLVSYWLTGTVNFAFFGVIGNLFLCGLVALLIRAAGTVERKWTMALLLAGLLFQLQHFENFFWVGSSIDHFQVPLLAGATVILLARGGWRAAVGAGVLTVLATFTLAHGLAIWPVGALMLAVERRWRQLAFWLALGAATGVGFFLGFDFNPQHQIGDYSLMSLLRIVRFWLEVLGAPFAFRSEPLAVFLGAGLLAALGWQIKGGGLKRERIALPLALWAVLALGLMAVGRASLGHGVLISRYYVLSGLAWAMTIFSVLYSRREGVRLGLTLRWLVPGLVAFNIAANVRFADLAHRWVADRDQAVTDFVRHGRDGAGPATLHPLPQHATRVIRQAEELGVFEMPRQNREVSIPPPAAGTAFPSAVDRIAVDGNLLTIDGWAALPGRVAKADQVHLVLRSTDSQHVLTTEVAPRPDVAAAFPAEQWRDAGFHFVLRRWLLPPENYQVGLLIATGDRTELVMTTHRVDLAGGSFSLETDKVAPNRMVYNEMIMRSPTASVAAAPRKFMRVTFFDLHDGLVHVDFSGPGEMTVTLAEASPLEPPPREQGRAVAGMRGAAAISIIGADETTNVSVFTARRQPRGNARAENKRRFDGLAHIASISIASRNGKFGGVRTGNVGYSAEDGLTGIHAPSVRFTGPVNVGDIRAFGTATPEFLLGFARDTRVAGGDLRQPNNQPVKVSGIVNLRFVDGRTAQGIVLPARGNRAKLTYNGRDVSARLVSRPSATSTNAPADD